MSEQNSPITILLADDHATTRAGIRALLDAAPDMQVIGEAENGLEAQRMVAELQPNILLLDLVMPDLRPTELEKWVRTHFPDTTTLILTAHNRDAYLASMEEAGAAGLVDKNEPAEKLLESIRRAARGEILFDDLQLARARRWRREAGDKWNGLSEREREVLRLLANEGLDNAAIAERLSIAPKTASFHVEHIMKKLEVKSRLEVVAWLHKYFPDTFFE
ncbi:MAG: response regulator [Chloroflexota bacterium]